MAHVRIRFAGQETWYRNVIEVSSTHTYVTLVHDRYPHKTYHHCGDDRLSVLICQTTEDVTQALREESPLWNYDPINSKWVHDADHYRPVAKSTPQTRWRKTVDAWFF